MASNKLARRPPDARPFTFPDTGITVQIRKFSPLLRDDLDAALRREYPPPDPPLNTVPGGFGDGATKQEPNESDPDWIKAVAKWHVAHYERLGERLFRIAVKRYIDCEVDLDAVKRLRDDFKELGVDLDPDDKYIYVTRICIGTLQDRDDLSTALFKRTAELGEAVDAHKATFRGDVSGPIDLADTHAANGAGV